MQVRRFSSPFLRKAWIPYFILVFTLLLSLAAMIFVATETKDNDRLRFQNLVERTQGTINNQLANYITLLEGTSGLFAASETVTRREFMIYVERLSLRQQYPGIQGIGYVERIPAAERDSVIARMRNEGVASFLLWPEKSQTLYYPVLYIEPLDTRNSAALGYDMGTEKTRLQAMGTAARTGRPALSGKVTLVQEIDANKQAGFLVYLPVYRDGSIPATTAEREANLVGFVYSPFRADDLLRGILGSEKSPQIDFRVYDEEPSEEKLLHDSRKFSPYSQAAYKPRFTKRDKFIIAGHTWTVDYTTNRAFDQASDIWLVPFVLIFGLLTSGVLFILGRAQFEAGRKAELSEENLHYIAEAGNILATSLDYHKTITLIAKLGVMHIADWCSVDIKRNGRIEQLAVAHKDPEQVKWAKRYRKLNPPNIRDKTGIAQVLRSGKAELYPEVTADLLRAAATSDAAREVITKIHMHSVMLVPLRFQQRTLGVMTYISTDPKRTYTTNDVAVAEEIAYRAATAIEHARLFAESEQAVKTRDDFISVASHELKTPVTSLKMYVQVIKKQGEVKGESQLTSALTKMESQIDKLTLLISDLLNVSRLQLGRLEFHDEYFDMNEAVADVVESIQPTTKQHTIRIFGTIKKKVYGDRDRLGQVLTNLLTNAIKYSPEATQVDVLLEDTRDGIHIGVRDYGIGIDKAHIDKIFQRFYRVSDSDQKTFPGLGIGLFISHEIIMRHGGKLLVSSERKQGSTFTMVLPRKSKV